MCLEVQDTQTVGRMHFNSIFTGLALLPQIAVNRICITSPQEKSLQENGREPHAMFNHPNLMLENLYTQ